MKLSTMFFWLFAAFALTAACGGSEDAITKEETQMDFGENLGGKAVPQSGWGVRGQLTNCNESITQGLQAVFPTSGPYTVQFSKRPNAAAVNPTVTEALIIWTTNGIQISRYITVIDGTSISGTAEAVQVTLFDKTPPNIPGPAANPDAGLKYDVAAVVASGVRAANSIPPVLLLSIPSSGGRAWQFPVPAGGTVNIDIPQDVGARGVRVSVESPTLTSIPEQGIIVNQMVDSTPVNGYDPRSHDWEPVTGATSLQLRAKAGLGFSVFCTIVLSIDG